MEEHLRDGRDVARKSRDQHQAIKEQLYRLQNLKAEDPDFESTFHSLSSDLQQYAKEAEERELPELENKLDDDSVSSTVSQITAIRDGGRATNCAY
ncbi:uncharacterized protein F4822DRAFT_432938 [Hypoxylon trugodes]|uniref:uncharacterized protein n=1 Tax=Hypoxylon trugodes TaxID=326681 RepID=UPI00218D9EA9|nr:uncharacterized protein F4822DRAFT_432938 [Hypoxylon trugodes]KAI1384392.1 hypothetical protein F4822DRAFT_432938 [Hypoxylon trugodes]